MPAWVQHEVQLAPRPRGVHLITDEVLHAVPELTRVQIGLMHVMILHTSASLTINENASPDVRKDFERHLNELVPEDAPYWTHTVEGQDDMPAHIKASMMGSCLTIPIRDGRPVLGTWQGIFLCEHRDHGGGRRLVVTVNGQTERPHGKGGSDE